MDKINELKKLSEKAGKYFENYSEEQIEAICNNAVTYRPNDIIDKIKEFDASVKKRMGENTADIMMKSAWYLQAVEYFDDERKQVNTEALVEELFKVVPSDKGVSKESIAAFLELKTIQLNGDD